MWRDLIKTSLTDPRTAARTVLAQEVPRVALVQGAIAVTCIGILLGYAAFAISPATVDAMSGRLLQNPLMGALSQLGVLLVVAWLTWRIGMIFGGTGGADGALALVVWLNAMMAVIQAVQVVVLAILPPFAALISLASVFWIFWAFTNFVAVLHGFESNVKVAGGIFMSMTVLFLVLAIFLTAFGFVPEEAM